MTAIMKDQTIEVHIDKLVYGGKGLAFWKGQAVFVPLVLPGERVLVRLGGQRKDYWEADLLEILEPSPERGVPRCRYFGKCGGCHWQHMGYATQLFWKREIVKESLVRLGKFENPHVFTILPSPQIWGWRSRIQIHRDPKGHVGFYREQSHDVIDIDECLIADAAVNDDLRQFRSESKNTHQMSHKETCELRSNPSGVFSQVNPAQNENLKQLLWKWAESLPHNHIVELFCGQGNLSSVFEKRCRTLVGVDVSREAILQARKCSPQFDFYVDEAGSFYKTFQPKNPTDLLVLDPPREGCVDLVEGVVIHQPKNIFYISCNPTTLARDLKLLREKGGYQLVSVQPIDMFPHSFHIESLSWMRQSLG